LWLDNAAIPNFQNTDIQKYIWWHDFHDFIYMKILLRSEWDSFRSFFTYGIFADGLHIQQSTDFFYFLIYFHHKILVVYGRPSKWESAEGHWGLREKNVLVQKSQLLDFFKKSLFSSLSPQGKSPAM
jgi:hypothetical protein